MTRHTLDRVARVWAIAALVAWVALFAGAIGATSTADAAIETTGDARLEQRRSQPQTSLEAIEPTVMCPTCDGSLAESESPAADSMRAWIAEAVEAGWTKQEIRAGLVQEYGGDESILAVPRSGGIGIGAWLAPLIIVLAAMVAALVVPRRWRRARAQTRSGSSSSAQSSSTSS